MEAARTRVGADVLGFGGLAAALISRQAERAAVEPAARVPSFREAL